MSEPQELVVPTDVVQALADLYWLFPFSQTVPSKKRPDKLVRLPLPPRAAPRRQIESAAERIGHPIPDWVVALWCCKVHLGEFSDQEPGQLGHYLVEVDRAAHEAGAPPSVTFFAGAASLYPGTYSYSARGKEFIRGALDSSIYGFEPTAAPGEPPRIVQYFHTARDPNARVQRLDLASYLIDQEREASLADDSDVYSKETYAGLVALREAKRPPFRLLWETTTPGLRRPEPRETQRGPEAACPVQVKHPKYGVGTVVARAGTGESEKLTIEFAEGPKIVLARFVQPV